MVTSKNILSNISLLEELYKKVIAYEIDFTTPYTVWMPEWEVRSSLFNNLIQAENYLHPYLTQWYNKKNNFPENVQIAISKSLKKISEFKKVLTEKNAMMLLVMEEEKESTRKELENCVKFPHAIASYAIHH